MCQYNVSCNSTVFLKIFTGNTQDLAQILEIKQVRVSKMIDNSLVICIRRLRLYAVEKQASKKEGEGEGGKRKEKPGESEASLRCSSHLYTNRSLI